LIDADRFLPRRPRVSFGDRGGRTTRRVGMLSMRADGLPVMPEELEVGHDPQGMTNLLASQQTPR
jgi:hypothetical protein